MGSFEGRVLIYIVSVCIYIYIYTHVCKFKQKPRDLMVVRTFLKTSSRFQIYIGLKIILGVYSLVMNLGSLYFI